MSDIFLSFQLSLPQMLPYSLRPLFDFHTIFTAVINPFVRSSASFTAMWQNISIIALHEAARRMSQNRHYVTSVVSERAGW
jgi:hypothetical protein